MTKKEFMRSFARRYGYTESTSRRVINELICHIGDVLASGEDIISLTGLGVFRVSMGGGGYRYKFSEGSTKLYPDTKQVRFYMSNKFKERVKSGTVTRFNTDYYDDDEDEDD